MHVALPSSCRAGTTGLTMTGQTVSAPKPQPMREWAGLEDNALAAQYPLAMDLLYEVLTIPQWDQNASANILVRCAKWCPRGGAPFFSAPSDTDLATLKTDMGLDIDPQTYMSRHDVQNLAELAIAIGMSYTKTYGFETCIVLVQTILTLQFILLRECANENLGSSAGLQKWKK